MDAKPTDKAFRIPQCYYKIPDPDIGGWTPVMKEIGSLDGKPRVRRRRTRGDRDDRAKLDVRSSGKRGRGVYSSSSSEGERGRQSKVARKGLGKEVVSGNVDGLESEGNKGVSGEEDIDSMSDWVGGESDEPVGVARKVGS